MVVEGTEARRSLGSSSTWSGPSSGDPSIGTFDSETASDPALRDPVERLRRWKERVALEMKLIRDEGQDGLEIIKRQPLRAYRRYNNLFMNDKSPLPVDVSFWKRQHNYFATEWRRIQEKKPDGQNSMRHSINPRLHWINGWISESQAAHDADTSDAARDADVCGRQSSKPPAVIVRQSIDTKKRPRDSTDEADEERTLPPKRPKRERPDHTKRKSMVTQAKQKFKKATASAAVAKNRLSNHMAGSREKAELETQATAQQPLRRSPRIAALYAAKAGCTEARAG